MRVYCICLQFWYRCLRYYNLFCERTFVWRGPAIFLDVLWQQSRKNAGLSDWMSSLQSCSDFLDLMFFSPFFLFQHVMTYLDFLQFLLKDGSQYLQWNRAKEIWDTLVTNPDACNPDREASVPQICFPKADLCLRLEVDGAFCPSPCRCALSGSKSAFRISKRRLSLCCSNKSCSRWILRRSPRKVPSFFFFCSI